MCKVLFNNVDYNKTVSEYFKNIWQQIIDNIINKKCDDKKVREQYNWLINFIETIRSSCILTYNPNLKKQIKPIDKLYTETKYLKKEYYEKYKKYKNKYLNLKNQLG